MRPPGGVDEPGRWELRGSGRRTAHGGTSARAALDVFESEPVDPARIADIPNLIATPHMAYYSEEALEESQRKAATQVIKVLTGQEPDYQVN